MRLLNGRTWTFAAFTIVVVTMFGSLAGRAAERNLIALEKSIRELSTVITVMNAGAHPDDERSAILAYLSRGLGVRTISTIANRGEGGQNAIGREYNELLGVVRTRELQEASEVTGVQLRILSEKLHDAIYDFGFSKSPEETIEEWGAERPMERLVEVIRSTRPDVIISSFRDEYGQHGHHRAIARLLLDAFELAADPTAFPEQIVAGLEPWKVKKLYYPTNEETASGGTYLVSETGGTTTVIPVGEFDPSLGVSYVQLGQESRSYHKSQGMGGDVPPGPEYEGLELIKSRVDAAIPESSIFDGLPYTVGDLAAELPSGHERLAQGFLELQKVLAAIQGAFPDRSKIVTITQRALARVRALTDQVRGADVSEALETDLLFRLNVKEDQLVEVSRLAANLVSSLLATDYEVVRGQEVEFRLSAFNGGETPLKDVQFALTLPEGWEVTEVAEPAVATLPYNTTAEATFTVQVDEDAPYFHPYRDTGVGGVLSYTVDGVRVSVPVQPEQYVAVLPDFAIHVDPAAKVFNMEKPQPFDVNVSVLNNLTGPATGYVRLEAPEGWNVEPYDHTIQFEVEGESLSFTFRISPAEDVGAGRQVFEVVARSGERRSESTVKTIEYEHIGRTYVVTPAALTVQAFPVSVPADFQVGYVASGSDQVAGHLSQMGFEVTLLGEDDLRFGDPGRYDAIVLGVRAYRSREDLLENNSRLLDYVSQGGHLVVQYNKPWDNWDADRLPPYRLVIGQPSFNWRVTDESAPVTILKPDHPVFNWPNQIGGADWEGWVKDRGLYFPMEWSEEYTPLVSMHDPGWEPMKGSILVAEYGEGTYLYTSLIFYYQMGRMVPGAFRIFSNMVSYPAAPDGAEGGE